ncbi:MAG: zinc ABC transporter substrate-binding protein [Planctomyces sp.]|nr:zinc ABC transporter substrate-binding protein [Planctomyces sp.]
MGRPDVTPVPAVAALAFSAVLLSGLTGCSEGAARRPSSSPSGDPGLTVVVTTGMVADLVRNVCGEHARVVQLMSSGVDPHLYKPTTSDITQVTSADLVVYNGLMLEGGLQSALERAAQRGRRVVAVASGLPDDRIRRSEQLEGHPDPHVWMDVRAWSDCLDVIVEALSELDPPHAAEFRANAERYRGELKQLDDYCRRVIASIPESQRWLVTAHDAFEYFSRAYGIPVRSVQGITTESEPGVEDINALVAFLRERRIPALFVESSVSDRNLQAVIEGARRGGAEVAIGGRLFSDAMGQPGEYEGTYIGMLDHNATVISRALGGEAPPRGLHGRLAETPR